MVILKTWPAVQQTHAWNFLERDWQNFHGELHITQADVLHMQDLCHASMHFCIPNAK